MLFRPVFFTSLASAMLPAANAGLLDGLTNGLGNVLNPILDPITSGADQLLGLNLDGTLLKDGTLVNVNAFAGLLSGASCSNPETLGLSLNLLNLVKVCACVDILNNQGQPNPNACPACPANADPVCGGSACACRCKAGFFADPASGQCLPETGCTSSGGVVTPSSDGTTATCVCPSTSLAQGGVCVPCPAGQTVINGQCTLGPSPAAGMRRKMKKNIIPAHPHAARAGPAGHQQVFAPKVSEQVAAESAERSCPDGEVACPLAKGGFECIDVSSSLTSCGGCVGPSLAGRNCLSIPGALGVECHAGKCQVGSCFRGWRFMAGKCV